MELKLKEYPAIMICGVTGSGKSTSMRNFPEPERVCVLNPERKRLPFRNANKFKNIKITSYKQFMTVLSQAMQTDTIDVIVVDSATEILSMIHKFCKLTYNGFTVYEKHNEMIGEFYELVKNNVKPLFLIALDEVQEGSTFDSKRFARTKGKEWKFGGQESALEMVLFTELGVDENGNTTFNFRTSSSGMDSTKTPDGMFEENLIPNDMYAVLQACESYWDES